MPKNFPDFFRERFGHELAPWQEELFARIRRESPLVMFTTPQKRTDPFFEAWMENQPKHEAVLIGADYGKRDDQGVTLIFLDEVAEFQKVEKPRDVGCSITPEIVKAMIMPAVEPEKPKREKFYTKFLPKRRLN